MWRQAHFQEAHGKSSLPLCENLAEKEKTAP